MTSPTCLAFALRTSKGGVLGRVYTKGVLEYLYGLSNEVSLLGTPECYALLNTPSVAFSYPR